MGPQDGLDADRQAAMTARKAARFDLMDSDANGGVSKAEFIAAYKAHFDAADAVKGLCELGYGYCRLCVSHT